MAIRSALARIPRPSPSSPTHAAAASVLMISRRFSGGTGRVLNDEERAAETIYIQKMEREKLEKMKQETDKAESAKGKAEKKPEAPNKG